MSNIDEFKRELDELLTKYRDLPEITLTIQPRVVINITTEKVTPFYPTDSTIVGTNINSLFNPDLIKSKVNEMDKMIKE